MAPQAERFSQPPPVPLPPDENIGITLIIVTSLFNFLSIVATCLRIWVRKANHHMGWDDWTIILATLFATARTGVMIAMHIHGNGRHIWYLTHEQYTWVVMGGLYAQLLLFPSVCFMKVSICCLLLRIKNTRNIKIWMAIIISGLVLTNLETEIVLLFECSPFQAYWNPAAGTCWPTQVRIYSIYLQVAYSVLTDLICTSLPIVVLWGVKIRVRVKVLVCGLMSLGLIATICAALRAASLGISTVDLSYDYAIASIWTNLEIHLGIIAANMACGRAIYKFMRSGCSPLGDSPTRHFRTGYFRTEEPAQPSALSRALSLSERRRTRTNDETEVPPYPNIRKVMEFSVVKSDPNLANHSEPSLEPRPEFESDEETKTEEETSWEGNATDATKIV